MVSQSETSPSSAGLILDHCTPEQAQQLYYDWSFTEHWNPATKGQEIPDVYLKTDAKAFFYGKVGDEVVSLISCMRYGQEQAWVGYYIVSPTHRGKGYGLQGFQRALAYAGEQCPSIGLDAVMEQVKNYQKSGFTETQWQNERRHGSIKDLVETSERELANKILLAATDPTTKGFRFFEDDQVLKEAKARLVNLADPSVDLEQLSPIEEKYTGLKRPGFLQDWVQFHAHHPESRRFGAAVLSNTESQKNGKPLVLGYGCVRPAETSYRVGPLYASSPEVARLLLVKLAVDVVQAEKQTPKGIPLAFDVDVPTINKEAVKLFDGLGWNDTFPSLRMWKGKIPKHDSNGVYGVATLEVG
ncbi:hypothetical protein KVV02_007750 [Mortierella alpina]|uniref:N-acetyltransferase domain-containing protein n=1 Tax=Mortierella alpina TaxID=64518 RepID=A0A9P8D1H9_MORAP|nr:hypothetical protein KVV02_007750 [Mortierella alpina]